MFTLGSAGRHSHACSRHKHLGIMSSHAFLYYEAELYETPTCRDVCRLFRYQEAKRRSDYQFRMNQGRDWHPLATLRITEPTNGTSGASSSTAAYKYDYNVEDVYVDPDQAPDVWAEFLRTRIARRRGLYEGLDPPSQQHIRKEVQRIQYFRAHFKDYRVFPKDSLPLVALLDDSRTKWRDIAQRRAADELARVQREIDRYGEAPMLLRNRDILLQVQDWKSKDYAAARDAMSPGGYMDGLGSEGEVAASTTDDPKKPDYGYNGWVAVWDKGKGRVSIDHPLVMGSFPHQKISIQQFLYNKENTPLRRSPRKDRLRYFHLPANNMRWVEEAMSRYYGEDGVNFDGKNAHALKHNSQRLLRNELWRGQQRGGKGLPVHARQIGARCSVVPSAPPEHKSRRETPSSSKDVIIFMPYLHWEVEKRLQRMNQFIQMAKSRKEREDRLRRVSTTGHRGHMANVAQKKVAQNMQHQAPRLMTGFEETEPIAAFGSQRWRPQTPLAKYIWHAAKLHQIIDEAADGRLIEDHLYSTPPLHMRRTLEQFYYWTAEDTKHRDREQITCRATKHHGDDPDPEATSRLVMVDQLWLWILDDNTVISSFPRRWGRNKPDPSAVHRGIRDRIGSLDDDEIQSVYDIAFIVIDECSKVFFDQTKPLDQRPEVVDLFSSAISQIAENKTIAYEGFGRDVSRISIDHFQSAEHLLRRSLNIGFEWAILAEAQQVIDELQIMQEIFTQQMSVMRDLGRALNSLTNRTFHPADDGQALEDHLKACEDIESVITDMDQRREELASMERLQTKTRAQVRELLDMKQQQANIIEAKAAIRRADESVLQGRSIVVFTVVTIFFLPLSFVSSVFGMNAIELSNDGLTPLSTQFKYMFGISAAVIILSLSIAFSEWIRTAISVTFSLVYISVQDRMGWRNRRMRYDSTSMRNLQRERMKQLESRERERRLTEINQRTQTLQAMQHQQEQQERSTWDVRRLGERGFFGLRRKKPISNGQAVAVV
ncbi:CorA-like Mg2+ transporter protein [Geosmithia morbida]|uniref:CorA-like Mg2+ transporter protein n=1 Tax=Geosmithia morbida TaxID=1094350 RepID=A0A9P4YY22_9HYPO|nr:CorA-like Mg2+ transporter protein [Geosmithia morbida]KAF4123894.1 CorA-like Mg2+ transporter protein [Geosmithia morbida]